MLRITESNLLAFRLANDSQHMQTQVGVKDVEVDGVIQTVPDMQDEYLTTLPSGLILGNHFPDEDGWCYIHSELSEDDKTLLIEFGGEEV